VAPTNNGGSAITGYTVTSNPGDISVSGTSPINVTGLTNETAYTFTVVAINSVDTSVASAASAAVTPAFACPTSTITYNSYTYNTVAIGNQCWMQENLRTRLYNDNTEISFNNSGGSDGVTPSETWSVLNYGAYTIYANDSVASPSNLTTYGYLYNWYAAKGIATEGSPIYKNICPTGWHVPMDAEWLTLTTGLGGESVAGGKMKSVGTAYWSSQSAGTDNSSGFSALPGGARNNDGSFTSIRGLAHFWSTTEDSSNGGAYLLLFDSYSGAPHDRYTPKSAGHSVRCLKD
jgi:uncharacterized protein (TIGR02145 family)